MTAPVSIYLGGHMMNTTYEFDPLETVTSACCNYKCALFGLVGPDGTGTKAEAYRAAACEYEKALKNAIVSLKRDLKRLEKEIEDYDH